MDTLITVENAFSVLEIQILVSNQPEQTKSLFLQQMQY